MKTIEENRRNQEETLNNVQSARIVIPTTSKEPATAEANIEIQNLIDLNLQEMDTRVPLANNTTNETPVLAIPTATTCTTTYRTTLVSSGRINETFVASQTPCTTASMQTHKSICSHAINPSQNKLEEMLQKWMEQQNTIVQGLQEKQREICAMLQNMQQQQHRPDRVTFQDTFDLRYPEEDNINGNKFPRSSVEHHLQTPCYPRRQGPGRGGPTSFKEM